MTEYMLMPMVGLLFDTTLAAAYLVLAGVPKRFPNIKWALGHLRGTIPYLMERLDRCFYAYEVSRKHISRPPSEYLKKLYYDTVNFDVDALRFTIDKVGVDQALAGSDYPHQIGRRMRNRTFDGQRLEVPLARKILNTMTSMGLPDSYRLE